MFRVDDYLPLSDKQNTLVTAMHTWLKGTPVEEFNCIMNRWGQEESWRPYRSVQYKYHDAFINNFGFSLPSREAITKVASFSPLLEIGAGTGYWSKLLTNAGANVIATDSFEEEHFEFHRKSRQYYPVLRSDAETAVRLNHGRNVFCSWPSLGGMWLAHASDYMKSGEKLIVVREECCACDETWDHLDRTMKSIEDQFRIPQFWGIHDYIQIWEKPYCAKGTDQ